MDLMKDKYIALIALMFLMVCYVVLLVLHIADAKGFLESLILLIAGSFVTLLKQQSSSPTNINTGNNPETRIENKAG